MKGYSNITKWLIAFVLVLIPVLVLAQTGSGLGPVIPGEGGFFENFTFSPPKGDMSVAFIAKMFGAVPGVSQLAGVSGTILGVIFATFNAGILAISGAFLGYTVVKVITETATDGAALAKSTTIWVAVRSALGVSLLVPHANGYSLINGVVMWMVMQSIGLADVTWNRALDYLKAGGGIYATAQGPSVDYTLINYDMQTGNYLIDSKVKLTNVGAADVLRSLTCAYAVHGALTKNQKDNYQRLLNKQQSGSTLGSTDYTEFTNSSKLIPEKSPQIFSVYNNIPHQCTDNSCTGGIFQFPYIANETAAEHPLKNYGLKFTPVSTPIPQLTGVCGTIGYTLAARGGNETAADYREKYNLYIPAKLKGLNNMIASLDPIAKQLLTQFKLEDGKRKLDPDAYVVYKDDSGSEKKFTFAPQDTPMYYMDATQHFIKTLSFEDSKVSGIKWPLGTDEMLNAAANYQLALVQARSTLTKALQDAKEKRFAEAKSQGWIGAGGYYRLLAATEQGTISDFENYRLKGHFENGNMMVEDASPAPSRDPSYFTLFPSVNNTAKVKSVLGIIGSDYKDTLDKALIWIYLSYPYSRLHGQVLYKAASDVLAGTPTGVGIASYRFTASPTFFVWAGAKTTEADLLGKLITGSVLIALVPPAAIPFLINLPLDYLKLDVNNVFQAWDFFMGPEYRIKDPIVKLQSLGMVMMEQSFAYISQLKTFFMSITIAISAAAMGYQIASWIVAAFSFWGGTTGISQSLETQVVFLNGLIEITQTVIFMYLPIGLAVLVPMLVSGAVFAIYVPLIPYLLFLFGVISWFISILVLMAAAPIICFIMMWVSQTGEGLLLAREAEQFILQLVGVFFRPTLMIIGLIAGMVLSYIGVDVLNLGFAKIVEAVIQPTQSENIRMIEQVGVMVIYTFTMVSLVNMCFSTIYLLYSEAMRAAGIAAPVTGMEERQLEAVKGAATQLMEAGAAGAKEGAVALKGAKAPWQLKAQPGKEKEKGAAATDEKKK